jgi:aspartate oxidase
LRGIGVLLILVIKSGAVVTGISYTIAVKVFLSGIILVGTVIQAVRDTITIKVRPAAAGIGYFITEQGETGIAAMDGAGTAIAGVGAGAEEVIIAGIGVVEVYTDTETVTFVIGTHVAVSVALGASCFVVW